MSASVLISVAGGSASHPAAGGLRLQMFLSRTVRRVISKFFDDTEVCIAGYNFPHSVGFKIFSFEVAEAWCDVSASVCEDHLGD